MLFITKLKSRNSLATFEFGGYCSVPQEKYCCSLLQSVSFKLVTCVFFIWNLILNLFLIWIELCSLFILFYFPVNIIVMQFVTLFLKKQACQVLNGV